MAASIRPAPTGTSATPTAPHADDILDKGAQAFLAGLHRAFEGRRRELLRARTERQARFDAGELPDFLAGTKSIREADWRVAPIPEALRDRLGRARCRLVEPVDPGASADGIGDVEEGFAHVPGVRGFAALVEVASGWQKRQLSDFKT